MQQETTRYQWMISSARRLQAGMRRGGGVGVLAVLLLLPLTAAGQAPLEALAPLKSDAEVEALGAVALGDLDTSFGSTGKVLTVFFDGSATSAVAIQSDGKIVVAGSALVRYNADGTLDTTFGDQGKVTTFCCGALAIQPDGKIVGAGVSGVSPGNVDFALVRYLPNGTLDTTFSGDGTVTTDFGNGRLDGAWAIVLQPDGKIVVVGASRVEGDSASEDVALARYLPNGSLDATFSGDGKVLTDLGSGEGDVATAVALQPDGKIVVAGYSFVGGIDSDVALARYRPNGTLDPTFGGDGTVLTDFRSGSRDFAFALAIQPRDGRLVVAGRSNASGSVDIALARYHAITCSGVVVTQIGTAGNDTIVGTPGNDVIFGFGGDDVISGLDGDDILCGGTGNDTLRGGSGNDLLSGGPGTDRCNGGSHGSGDTASGCERVTGVP